MMDYVEMYKQMHKQSGTFPGKTVYRHQEAIGELIKLSRAKTVLDFGCGKGRQYGENPWGPNLSEVWQVEVLKYDPAVPEHSTMPPKGVADLLISTDVLEHVPMGDVVQVLSDMFTLPTKAVFLTIAMEPALAVLPNGENAHCTLLSQDHWLDLIWEANVNQLYTEVHFMYYSTDTDVEVVL